MTVLPLSVTRESEQMQSNRIEQREVRAVVLLAAGQRERETVGDREGLERWSCSPLSRAPRQAAGRWTWALGRVPTWTERCSGAGSTRLLLLGLPRRTSRKKRRTGNLEQETGGHKIDEKLDQIKINRDQTFHRPSQGSW